MCSILEKLTTYHYNTYEEQALWYANDEIFELWIQVSKVYKYILNKLLFVKNKSI